MARRRKAEGGWDVLMSFPWQVTVGLAVVVFVGLRWVLPAVPLANPVLHAAIVALSSLAWFFSGLLLLIGLFRLATQKRAASVAVATRSKHAGRDPQLDWRPPAWAPKGNPHLGHSVDQGAPGGSQTRTERREPANASVSWSLDLLRQIEWKRFEDLCQQYYETKGVRSETTPLGADGGIDIRLYQDDSGKPTSVVQCKAWGGRFVGVKPVRELLGVITHERIAKGFFMTSGRFSDDAKAVATSNPITLIDGPMFLMMIQRLPADAQQRLLSFATAGDYKTPTCPGCGIKMHRVAGKGGRPDFWGCSSHPRCHHTFPVRRAM